MVIVPYFSSPCYLLTIVKIQSSFDTLNTKIHTLTRVEFKNETNGKSIFIDTHKHACHMVEVIKSCFVTRQRHQFKLGGNLTLTDAQF